MLCSWTRATLSGSISTSDTPAFSCMRRERREKNVNEELNEELLGFQFESGLVHNYIMSVLLQLTNLVTHSSLTELDDTASLTEFGIFKNTIFSWLANICWSCC